MQKTKPEPEVPSSKWAAFASNWIHKPEMQNFYTTGWILSSPMRTVKTYITLIFPEISRQLLFSPDALVMYLLLGTLSLELVLLSVMVQMLASSFQKMLSAFALWRKFKVPCFGPAFSH